MSLPLALQPTASSSLAIPPAGALTQARGAPDSLTLPPASPAPPPTELNPYLSTPPPQFTETVISLADIVGYMRKRAWLGFLVGLPFAALVFYALGMGAKVYEAEAKLRLRLQDANVFNFSEMSRNGVTELSAPMLVNNHLTEIKSRRYIDYFFDHFPAPKREAFITAERSNLGRKDQLLKALGLYQAGKPDLPKEVFAESLDTAIRVEPQKESHILRIQVRNHNPRMAADIANSYAQFYIDFFGEEEAGRTEGERAYLQQKAAELRVRLEDSERKLAEYRKTESLMQDTEVKDVDAEKVRLLTAAITDASLRLTKAKNDLQIIRSTQDAGGDLLNVRVVADNPEVAFNRKELDAKVSERKALEPMCGRRHPQMIALASEIMGLQATLERAKAGVVAMAEAEVRNQERQIVEYENQLESARSQALDQSGKHVQQSLLRDKVAMDRELYQKIVLRLNQADLTGQFKESGALSLSDIATVPDKPVKPNKPIAAIASLMALGLCFFGIPIGAGLFEDHVMKALRQVPSPASHAARGTVPPAFATTPVDAPQVLGLPSARPSPFTAQAPPVPPAPPPVQHTAAQMPPAVSTLGQAKVLARLPIVRASSPESALNQLLKAEPEGASGALHQLTSTLEKQALTRSGLGGVIMVTSAEVGEGKTVASAALAAAFCKQGRSAFLMECNAVAPALHHWFPNASSNSSWAQELDALRYGDSNLFLLPAHDLPSYATHELLDGYRAWIERARHQVDWVILDVAPVLRNFADVAPLAPLATDVVVVHNPTIISQAKLRAAMSLLQPMMSSSALRGLILHG